MRSAPIGLGSAIVLVATLCTGLARPVWAGPGRAAGAEESAAEDRGEDATRAEKAAKSAELDGSPSPAKPGQAKKNQGEKSKSKSAHVVKVGGRVFVRDAVRRPGWTNELTLDSARIDIEYKGRRVGDGKSGTAIEVRIKTELSSGEAEIRDGYVRISPTRDVRVQAGRFKRPISGVALESRWNLPVVDRGIVSDLELNNALTAEPDRLPLGGRSEGVSARLRLRHRRFDPRITVGVFRGEANRQLAEASIPENRAPITLSDGFPEDIYARVEVEPTGGVRMATSLGWYTYLGLAGTRDTFKHGIVSGLDAVVKKAPIHLWLEAYVGTSPLHFGTDARARGAFVAVRAIAATRLVVSAESRLQLEPYLSGQFLDASNEFDDDWAGQVVVGVNLLGGARSWRLQTAISHLEVAGRLFGDATQFVVQLGAVF
ncbi:MAG: hypothetical protein MJE77_34380 [Proteobacteria bacterium]|nr:hypothetical protein [Pseudomonadota bacterium]